MTTLSRQLAELLQSDLSSHIDDDIHRTVLIAFLDTVGCILSGRDEPVTRKTAEWIRSHYRSRPEARWLLSDERNSVGATAMINAVSGHALDFDDVALAGHPSVVLVPVLLAESDRSGLRGIDLVAAYVKGYQVWAELVNRLSEPLHDKGWHPTAVLGTIGAAAALCAARKLSIEQTQHALGIAASRASGLVANFGSMTKPLHAGWAAEQGVSSVELAELGVTASADALDARNGFLRAMSDQLPPILHGPCAGADQLAIRSVRPSVKKYPVCYAAHRAIDGVVQLRGKHGVQPHQVERIDVEVSPTNAQVLKYAVPATPLEAKFSMPFACASALVMGNVGLGQLNEETLAHPDVQRLMPRVHVSTVDTQCPLEPTFALHDRVRITLADGQVLDSGPIRFALGHALNPLRPEQIRSKVRDCAGPSDALLAEQLMEEVTGRLDLSHARQASVA